EGGEGGGFKNPSPVSSLVLLPLVREHVDVPIIAAGGICDGVSMAAAFALGAEGVQMGTRMVSALESPVHDGWKNAIVAAAETDTVFLRSEGAPALRALRTERTERMAAGEENPMQGLANGIKAVYFEGKIGEGVALTGEVAGRIDAIRPVADIIADTVREFAETISKLSAQLQA
ncbi:MAG: nitronate monooxygenase, partial [Myxococcota bacterium]